MRLDAPILPGLGAADLRLGDPIAVALAAVGRTDNPIALVGNYPLHAGVCVWQYEGIVDQIMIGAPYTGRIADRIGIGSSVAEVEDVLGPVIEDEDDILVVPSVPGWGFETDVWNSEDIESNKTARITEIFVFRPS